MSEEMSPLDGLTEAQIKRLDLTRFKLAKSLSKENSEKFQAMGLADQYWMAMQAEVDGVFETNTSQSQSLTQSRSIVDGYTYQGLVTL